MRILFDHCTPRPLRRYLIGHEVKTAYQMRWNRIVNGGLLSLAETQFDVFLTVDQNIPDQQNMRGRAIAVIVLVGFDTSPVTLAPLMPQVLALLPTVQQAKCMLWKPKRLGTIRSFGP